MRADIDYHYTTASTKYGIIGIKVWIAKGEIYTKKSKQSLMRDIVDLVDGNGAKSDAE